MQIKNIKYNEKQSLFEITVNEENFFISYEIYNELNLSIGKNLNNKTYQKIINENNFQKVKFLIKNFINYKSRTIFETKLKIREFINDKYTEDKIIDYYKNLGLLDDENFSKNYLDYCLEYKKYSIDYTIYKLKTKGIKFETYENFIYKYENIDNKNIKDLFEKKYKNLDLSNYKNKQKIYRYFSSKGFKYNDIENLWRNDE